MQCRRGCAACCIAPSIASAIPGMPQGKPAGVACVNLDSDSGDCRIWGTPQYPVVCTRFTADLEHCGESREEAIKLLTDWEELTNPDAKP